MTRTGHIYTRCSPADLRRGSMPEHQEDLCRAWCRAAGVEVAGVSHDTGTRGIWKGRSRALDAVVEGHGLVVARLDRFGVDPADTLRIVARLGVLGWVAAVMEGIDTHTQPAVAAAWRALASVDPADVRADVRTAKQVRGPTTNQAPFGWRWVTGEAGRPGDPANNGLVADPEEQDTLAVIMRMWADGHRASRITRATGVVAVEIPRIVREETQRRVVAARRQPRR